MPIRLSDEARRHIATFSAETGALATDCLVDDELVFVVAPDDMARAIGPHGQTVAAFEDRVGRDVILVEGADRPEVFIANALAPAAVYDVELHHVDGESIAIATVDPEDVGVAIGRDGRRVDRARTLAARHFSIDDIEVREADG